HATGLPGVPLEKQTPTWIPGRMLIDYVTGAALLGAAVIILINRKARTASTCLGGWILLMVLVIYGPVLIVALSEPGAAVKVEGRSEEHTSALQSHRDLHSFPTRRSSDLSTCLGGWILLMVLVIYGPVLIVALSEPGAAVKVEG